MADADYRAWVEVLPEFQRFNENVEAGVVGGLAGAGASGSNAMGGALIAGIGKFAVPIALAIGALGIASSITGAIQSGVDAGIQYVSSAVSSGSDYNESLNAIAVAYGDYAAEIDRISQSSATDLGLSQLDFNAIATRFSAFAKTIQEDNPVGFIDELTTRGADFASVFNLKVSEALSLFQSGLAGETEPLRRYGIDLSAATVQAYAWANGIAEQGKQLTEAQRQQAAYGALMQQTSQVQGDFANTSDELANRERILQAQWADAQAQLGMQLLPVLKEVLGFVSEELMPQWLEFNKLLGPALKEALEEAWPTIKEMAEQILPLIPPAIEAIIGGLDWFGESVAVIITYLNFLHGTFSDFFALIAGDISIDQFVANFQARLNEWLGALQTRLASAVGFFQDMGVGIATTIAKIGANLYNSGRAIIQQFIDGIRSMLGAVGNAIGGVMDWVAGFFPNSPAKRGAFAGQGWVQIAAAGGAIADQFESGFRPVAVPLSYTLTDPADGMSFAAAGLAAEDGARASRMAELVELGEETLRRIAQLVTERLPSAIAREGRLNRRMDGN